MKKKPRSQPPKSMVDGALMAFVPLLIQQGADVREEAQTNKQFHLGKKEYNYVPTLSGHEPL